MKVTMKPLAGNHTGQERSGVRPEELSVKKKPKHVRRDDRGEGKVKRGDEGNPI
jgi:hypothetical protein